MSSYGRYHFEYQVCQAEGIIPRYRERELLSLPPEIYRVYFDFAVKYILKKRPGRGDDEILACDGLRFWLPWDFIVGLGPYDIFNMYFSGYGVREDVKEELIQQIRDLANQMKADPSNAGCRLFQMAVSIQIYTVQQEDETIESAKDRAITKENLELDWLGENKYAYLPGKWSFIDSLTKGNNPGQVSDECCVCLNGSSAGGEIYFLPCSHAYHSECIITWLLTNPACPFCFTPVPCRSYPWD